MCDFFDTQNMIEVKIKNKKGVVVIRNHKSDVDNQDNSYYNRHIIKHDSVFPSLSSLKTDKGGKI